MDIVSASFRFMACCHRGLLSVLLLGLLGPGCASDPTAVPGNHRTLSSETSEAVFGVGHPTTDSSQQVP